MKLTLKQLKTLLTLNEYSTRDKAEFEALMAFETYTNEILIKKIVDFDKDNDLEKLSDEEYADQANTLELEVDIPNKEILANILEKGITRERQKLNEQKNTLKEIEAQVTFFEEIIKKLK